MNPSKREFMEAFTCLIDENPGMDSTEAVETGTLLSKHAMKYPEDPKYFAFSLIWTFLHCERHNGYPIEYRLMPIFKQVVADMKRDMAEEDSNGKVNTPT